MNRSCSEWRTELLGDISKIRRGASPRPIDNPRWFSSEGPGWVRISDVTGSDGVLRKTEQKMSLSGVERSVKIHPGDLIMSICATIGVPIVSEIEACIHDGFVVFHDYRKDLETGYLYHFLRWWTPKFCGLGQTGTQANLNTGIVNKTTISVPPKNEQRVITAILDSVDETIRRTETLIAKLRQVKAGMLNDLLTKGLDENGKLRDPIHHSEQFKDSQLGKIPKEWEIKGLLEVAPIVEGQVDPQKPPFVNLFLVAPDHIESGTGRLLNIKTAGEQGAISGKYRFQPGDVVYCKIRPYLRKVWIAFFDGLCSADMYPFRPCKEIDSYFLLMILLSEKFSNYAISVSERSGFPKINRNEISFFEFALPPKIEQERIAKVIKSIDRKIESEETERSKMYNIKQSLMQDLLTGRVCAPASFIEKYQTEVEEN